MTQIWISAAGLCGATLLGSLLGFFIKNLPHKWNDTILGYCAGLMLAASIIGLIVPGVETRGDMSVWIVVAGALAGGFFLNILDLLTPHLHTLTGLDAEEHRNNHSLNRIMLFVMAIAIHKLPEGVAAGVTLTEAGDTSWIVTIGIALQNIPEGMVIIAPLLMAGVSHLRTLLISIAIGLLEVVGVWAGAFMGYLSASLLPVMLSFAGGAMLYVISDEMIPETHAHGNQKLATYALITGFMTLLVIEEAFE